MGREDWTPAEIEAEEKYIKEGLMADWELTPVERGYRDTRYYWLNRLLLDQARKLVEYQEQMGMLIHADGTPQDDCPTCKLRKEVGLE